MSLSPWLKVVVRDFMWSGGLKDMQHLHCESAGHSTIISLSHTSVQILDENSDQ